jgi:photosystem II stability/assembly factor-like uncharacterized protein
VAALAVGGVAIIHRHQTSPARPTPTPTPAPTTPAPKPAFPGFRATATYFVDPADGWALGDGRCVADAKTDCATLLSTTDGGRHWSKRSLPAGLVSTQDGASCGDNGGIAGPCVDQVAFANHSIGYLWSFHKLYMTVDGARSWTDLHTDAVTSVVFAGDTAIKLYAIAACSSPCAYRVSAAPLGTDHWTTVTPAGPTPSNGTGIFAHGGTAYLVTGFVADTNGQYVGSTPKLYASTDGHTWQLRNAKVCTEGNNYGTLSPVPGPTGLLASICTGNSGSTVAVSTDGGATFGPAKALPASEDGDTQVSVVALSPTRLVLSAEGTKGETWLSADGGSNWRIVDEGSNRPYNEQPATFLTPTEGYRMSDGGLSTSVTTDGGATWIHLGF